MTTMTASKAEPTAAFTPVTRNSIIREYFRLMEIANDAEEEREYKWYENGQEKSDSFSLLDAEHAQQLRAEYHQRAEVVLTVFRNEARQGRPVGHVKEAVTVETD